MIVWFPKRFSSSRSVKSLFHTLNLDPKIADKNLHWTFWTLPISVNWIFNGREKDSDQHEKYLYQLLTHVKEGPKRDICNVYPAWCCNVCASGTETFHLLFLSPKCHVVGAPRIKFPITTSFSISPCCSNNLLPFSRSQMKSDEVLDSCACSGWPKNATGRVGPKNGKGTTGSHCRGAAVM